MSRRLNKKLVFFLILAAVAGYFLYQRIMGGNGGPMGMSPGGAPPVSVAEVIKREVQLWHDFSGRLVAVDSADIRPRVSGTIDNVHFKEGQWVKKGQALFTIDPRPYEASMQAASARAQLADAELKRAESLLKDKAISQRDFDQRKNAAEVAKADATRAGLDRDYTLIKAPIAGRISRAEITVGNLVDAGGAAPVLASIVSDRPIYADFDIDEQTLLTYLEAVQGDMTKLKTIPVKLSFSEGGAVHEGRVQSFDNQLNVRSGTIRVRAVFDNKEGALIPGLFARLKMGEAGAADTVLVTDRAIGTDQNKKFVLVVGPENVVEYREVKLGGSVDGLRIITQGLKPGEKIIVNGLQRARPGTPVTPEMVPMDETK